VHPGYAEAVIASKSNKASFIKKSAFMLALGA
jgi:hypothetical protein